MNINISGITSKFSDKQLSSQTAFEAETFFFNIERGRLAAYAFFILVPILCISLYFDYDTMLFQFPGYFYLVLSESLLLLSFIYLSLYKKIKAIKNPGSILINTVEVLYLEVVLFWGAGISLIDCYNYKQIVIYLCCIFLISTAPYIKPVKIILVYAIAEAFFVVSLFIFHLQSSSTYSDIALSVSIIVISVSISVMRYSDRIENYKNRITIEEKNNELKMLNEILTIKSEMDALTNIYNRRKFNEIIQSEWERAYNQHINISILMIDVDYFKRYNDFYGHISGDRCLVKIAEAFKHAAGDTYGVFRYGGEEFVFIMPETAEQKAYLFAENVRIAVESLKIEHRQHKSSKYVTVSIGVNTMIPDKNILVEDFINLADEALYDAKSKGRNNVVAIEKSTMDKNIISLK